ncbi:MAG: DUF951 domain-containing protein [Caldilineales bacterium]|nr:DUF951 domain-containing protein [Caldilineales bacterium]
MTTDNRPRSPSFLDVRTGDIVRLRKKHPCGGFEWEVYRVGADIGLVCQTCRRRLMLPRDKFRHALKAFVRHAGPPAVEADPAAAAEA